jgi:putative flippase GtrA
MIHSEMLNSRNPKSLLKFLVVGGLGSVVSYSVFVLLSFFWQAWLSYTVAYIIGLVIGIYFNVSWVFRVSVSPMAVWSVGFVYLVSYWTGRLIIHIMDYSQIQSMFVVGAVVILVTAPMNFFGSRLVLSKHSVGGQ